jgi:hypothetical protein
MLRFYIFLLILLMITVACGRPPDRGTIPCPWQSSSDIYLEQDFSTDTCHWDKDDESSHYIQIENGLLQIFNTMPGIQVLTYLLNRTAEEEMLQLPGLKIEVEVQEINGNQSSLYGIICKAQYGFYDYYYASINGYGYYEIVSLKDMKGQQSVKGVFDIEELDTHYMRLDCLPDSVNLYVDGKFVDSLPDNKGIKGMIGLFAESPNPETKVLVAFDNLKISKP